MELAGRAAGGGGGGGIWQGVCAPGGPAASRSIARHGAHQRAAALAHLFLSAPLVDLRLSVEFHLFLTALSVRPGSSLAMMDHLLPLISWACAAAGGRRVRREPGARAGSSLGQSGRLGDAHELDPGLLRLVWAGPGPHPDDDRVLPLGERALLDLGVEVVPPPAAEGRAWCVG